jgi:hypothetical protein
MAPIINIPGPGKESTKVHLIDGTGSHQSYGVVARRGNIFLGVKFSGLTDGARFGLPGTTYLHVRLRSARVVELAALLDSTKDQAKIFNICLHQLSLDGAWPSLSFEKVDAERASLAIGLFIHGSLTADTATVITRIQQGDLFRKLIAYVAAAASQENCIVDASALSHWLANQAKPMLNALKKKLAIEQMTKAAHQEFGATVEHQMETIDPHMQQLSALYQKHMQADLKNLPEWKNSNGS